MRLAWSLRYLLAATAAVGARGFVVVGYVPEHRFTYMDWNGIVARTTHLILQSAQPDIHGNLIGLDSVTAPLRDPSSSLQRALRRTSIQPQVLISIGGVGKSDNFAEMLRVSKRRNSFAAQLVQVLKDLPNLAGVDLCWEKPENQEQWRDLGKLAKVLREQFDAIGSGRPKPLLTMAYHPFVGAISAFAGLQGKTTGRSFSDFFDLMHVMAYSYYDHEKKHSSLTIAKGAIDEWTRAGLSVSRLTLGVPFYGVSRANGQASTYNEILDGDPRLLADLGRDESSNGMWFNNAHTLARKVELAASEGLAGVMVWDLSHDKASSNPSSGSLLRPLWEAAMAVPGGLASQWRPSGGR